jgi:CDP-diacylglycerol--glycerol-3-phosphate 3-phosphatidyltransferase
MQAKVGIAERADRLVAILFVTGAADIVNRLGVGEKALWAIPVTLAALAVASTVTVVQRVLVVRQQATTLAQPTPPAG